MKSKEQKRSEAIERQAEYDALTPAERHLRMRLRPGQSLREWERELMRAIGV
jgi:hypothetical protein